MVFLPKVSKAISKAFHHMQAILPDKKSSVDPPLKLDVLPKPDVEIPQCRAWLPKISTVPGRGSFFHPVDRRHAQWTVQLVKVLQAVKRRQTVLPDTEPFPNRRRRTVQSRVSLDPADSFLPPVLPNRASSPVRRLLPDIRKKRFSLFAQSPDSQDVPVKILSTHLHMELHQTPLRNKLLLLDRLSGYAHCFRKLRGL